MRIEGVGNLGRVGPRDVDLRLASQSFEKLAGGGHSSDLSNHVPVKAAVAIQKLEAVLFGRIVRAGYHDPCIEAMEDDGKVQHRGRPKTDPPDVHSSGR